MTFLAPGFLLAAAVAAAGIVGLHLLVARRGPSAVLPTTRFVPATATAIVAVEKRPRDLLLLLTRVAAIALAGVAFARPQFAVHRTAVVRIVVADRSSDVADMRSVRDSVRQLLRDGDALVIFDSAAHAVPAPGTVDTVAALERVPARGRLSSALIVARREAARRRGGSDSIEMDLVSPVTGDEIDAATPAIRALWPGRIRVVTVAGAPDSPGPSTIMLRGEADDPLRAATPLRRAMDGAGAGARAGATADPQVLIVRDLPTATDSAWVRAGQGRVLIAWPAAGVVPPWPAREPGDTAGAVVAFQPDAIAVVASFARSWRLDAASGRVRARWIDGEPAVVEHPMGCGCIRDAAIPVSATGDLVLRPEFGDLVAALLRPCGDMWRAVSPATPAAVAMIVGTGPLLASDSIDPATESEEPAVPWLLGTALLLIVAELIVRRGRANPALQPVHLEAGS
jgi:hypothetical protein